MANPNLFHDSNWSMTFSNMPTISNMNDMLYYDGYVKSCLIPNYNIMSKEIAFKNSSIFTPISRKNEDPSQLSIAFKLSENATNYVNLFQFMQQLRYGQNLPTDFVINNLIEKISVNFFDNQKRSIGAMVFTKSFVTSLSSLNLQQGTNNEITFEVTFMYTQMLWENA